MLLDLDVNQILGVHTDVESPCQEGKPDAVDLVLGFIERFNERAAIFEFDGRTERPEAERLAMQELLMQYRVQIEAVKVS